MPTPDTNANTCLQADSDWPQILEQWKRARRSPLLRYLSHHSANASLVAIISMFGGMMLPLILVGLHFNPVVLMAVFLPFSFFGLGLMLSSTAWYDSPLTPVQKRLAERLDGLTDIRAVGPLLELRAEDATPRERKTVQNVLTRLLSDTRPSNGEALMASQRASLYHAITTHTAEHDKAFFLACLDAVEQVGDMNALVPLTRIIVADAPTQAQQIGRERARQCRDTLLARLDFGGISSISTWLDYLPAQTALTPPQLEQVCVPMYALTRLLPRLNPADAPLLTPRNRQTLLHAHKLIQGLFIIQSGRGGSMGVDETRKGRFGPDFELAVLDALAQIGTGDDAHYVHTLLDDGSSAYNRGVRTKARDILPILEARRVKEEAGRTLLRGAEAPAPVANQLLRPADDTSNASATRPDELLRAPTVPPPSYQAAQTVEEAGNNTLQAGL